MQKQQTKRAQAMGISSQKTLSPNPPESRESTTEPASQHDFENADLYARVKRPGTSGYLGQEYEWNLLGLILLRAEMKKHKFHLTSDHSDIGAFDDIVLQLLSDDAHPKATVFLQAKHKKNAQAKRITIQQLSLDKYLHSYLLIKSKFLNPTTIFCRGNFDACRFVICTNNDLDPSVSKAADLLDNDNELWELINSDDDKKIVQLDLNEGSVEALADSMMSQLAQEIYDCTLCSKKKKIGENETFEIHRRSLVNEVFEVKFKKFHDKLPQDLWTKMFHICRDKHKEEISENEFNDKLKETDGKLTFGTIFETIKPTEHTAKGCPALSMSNCANDVKQFLAKFYLFLRQPNHDELQTKFEDEVGTILGDKTDVRKTFEEFIHLVKDWSGEEQGQFLTEKNHFFNEAVTNVLIPKLDTLTKSQVQQFENYGIRFKDDIITTLANDIRGATPSEVLCIVASEQSFQLSSIKLCQAMHILKGDNWETFFLKLHDLSDLVNSQELSLFRREQTLIACEVENTKNWKQLLMDLRQALSHNQDITVVLITDENVPGHNFIRDEFKFNTLTIESQKKLGDKDVTLQGIKTKLSQLIDTDGDKWKDIFTGEVVMELIKSTDGISVRKAKLLSESDEAYIKVSLEVSVDRLKKALSEWTDTNTFLINDMGDEALVESLKLPRANILHSCEDQEISEFFMKKCTEDPYEVAYLVQITETTAHLREIYNPSFYYGRTLNQRPKVVINPRLLKEMAMDQFICYGTPHDKVKLLDDCKNVDLTFANSESDAKSHFQQLCNTPIEGSIHLLQIEGQKLVWQRSQGSLKIIRDNIDQDLSPKLLVKESEFEKTVSDKFVIIADDPGMGKSTTLTSLSMQMMEKYWVMRIDLRNCKKAIVALPGTSEVNLGYVNKFLLNIQNIDLDSKLSKSLLKHKLENTTRCKPILLLLDGYDEIDKDGQRKIDKFLQFLRQQTQATVCVTTRKTFKNHLEDNISTFAIEFEEFDVELQKEFLSKYWQLSLSLTCNRGNFEESLEKYSQTLIERANKVLEVGRAHFMGIPLQLRMLAEGFQNEVTDCLNGIQDISIAELSLLGLYDRFISKKYAIYFKQKKKYSSESDMETLSKTYDERHGILAFSEFFPDNAFPFETMSDVHLNELKSVGIIQSIGTDREIYFIHRTFAEYFIAKLLFSHLQGEDVKSNKFKTAIQFLDKQELYLNHRVIHKFLNLMLSKESTMHKAVLENDLALVVNTAECDQERKTDILGRTALHLAAEMGNEHIVSVLLLNGYDATGSDNLGRSPLHYAAIFRRWTIVKCVLDHIADIDICDNIFSKPLHDGTTVGDCIFNSPGHLESVLFNLVNAPDEYGISALTYSCEKENQRYQDHGVAPCILLLNGAKISHIPQGTFQCLFTSDTMQYRAIDALLLLKFPVDIMQIITELTYRCEGILYFSVNGGHTSLLRQIVTCLTQESLTRYRFSITWRFTNSSQLNAIDYKTCISYLLDNGISENDDTFICKILNHAAGKSLWTVYHDFQTKGSLSLSQRLIPAIKYDRLNFLQYIEEEWYNCKLNETGDYALHLAASHGSLKIIKYLLQDKKVDINIRNNKNQTPLFCAAINEAFQAVKHLIQKGALIHTIDKNGETALDVIAKEHRDFFSEALLNICKSLSAESEIPKTQTRACVVREIMTTGRHDVNKADVDGVYLLQKAAKYTSRPFLAYLIDQGADPNVRDKAGKSALHYAAANHVINTIDKVIEHLLKNGSIYDARDNANNTFLQYIPQLLRKDKYDEWYNKVEEAFRNVSLCLNLNYTYPFGVLRLKDSNLNTLLHLAISSGNRDACNEILKQLDDEIPNYKFLTNRDGNSPLHIAVQKGFVQIAELLLQRGFMNNIPSNEH